MMPRGNRAYRLVLRAFPASFRRRHGADMTEHFEQRQSAVRGRPLAIGWLWTRALCDAVGHGLALRCAQLKLSTLASVELELRRSLRALVPRGTEVRQALRALRKTPWYSATVVAVIMLSTALSATVFAIVDGVLFKSLPYPEAENLYRASSRSGDRGGGVFKMDEIAAWHDAIPGLQVAAMQFRSSAGTLGDGRTYGSVAVDEHFFDVLGQRPHVGGFAADDFRHGAAPVALISYRLWQRVFAGQPSAIGQVLPLVGAIDRLGRPAQPPTVVGILPRDFAFPEFANEIPDVIRPLTLSATERSGRNESTVFALLRRPGDMSIEELQGRLDAAVRASRPTGNTNERLLDGANLRAVSEMALPLAKDFRMLAIVAASLIALACLGVGGLSSARVRQRERDVVLRRSLGATTWDVFRQTVTEVAPLVLTGAGLGLAMAPALLEFTLALVDPQTGFVKPPHIDPRVATVAAGLAALTTLAVALGVIRTAHRGRLIASGSTSATGRVRGFGQAIVAGQTGLAFALTLGGALVVTSLWNVWRTDPGFDGEHIAAVHVSARAPDRATVVETALGANDDLARLPGVEAAGIFGMRLLQHGSLMATVRLHPDGKPIDMQQIAHGGNLSGVIGLLPVRGRLPTPAEFARRDPVVLISERAAASLWPGKDPLGRPLWVARQAVTVIGVVRDLRFTALDDVRPRAAGQVHTGDLGYRQMTFVLRTNGRPDLIAAAARDQLARTRRGQLDVLWAGTMDEALAGSIAKRRFAAWVYGGFALCALAITTVGVLGLVAMMTSLRTREVAVRLALGAAGTGVIRLLLKEQLTAVLIGLAGGGLFAAWGVGALRGTLYGITTSDPRIWTATALIILATAALGTLIPALRAAAIDPIKALRIE